MSNATRAPRLRALLAFLLVAAAPTPLRAHAIHSTLTDITLTRDGVLTVRIRAFADDLSLAVNRLARTTPRADHTVPDGAAARYALATFSIASDGKSLPLQFISQRRTGDVVWMELRGRVPSLSGAMVRNTMLFDVHADQVNVVKTTVGRATFTMLFSPGDAARPIRL